MNDMSSGCILLVFLVIIAIVYLLVKFIRKQPIRPDPWEGKMPENQPEEEEVKVCVNCLEPIVDEKIHYCPKCGNVVGDYTRYIPFVNIQFNYSIFGTLFKKLKKRPPENDADKHDGRDEP